MTAGLAPRLVAGVDAAYGPGDRVACGAAVVWDMVNRHVVEEAVACVPDPAPYVPGQFAARELPVLLAALAKLATRPGVVLVDGHGLAHPQRHGLACRVGLQLGMPSVGCAKSILVGSWGELGEARGSRAPLVDGGEVVGVALRTRDGVRPVFVSVGHLLTLEEACEAVLACARTRIPEPLRAAHAAATVAVRGFGSERQ